MNFWQEIFSSLRAGGEQPVLRDGPVGVQARELFQAAQRARMFLRASGVAKGDRVVVCGDNSARWAAIDLAIGWEGALAVPVYGRLDAKGIADMVRDCQPTLILCDTDELMETVDRDPDQRAGIARFADATATGDPGEPVALDDSDPVRIVYTSGTSGQAKGAVLTLGNVDFVLRRTSERLDELMEGHEGQERVYHYLPCCFAGSWILMLTALQRGALLTLCGDVEKLGEEIHTADPHYFLNVPLVLDRVRRGIEELIRSQGGFASWIWRRPWLARWLLYPAIRRQLAPSLRAFICGSAPLSEETQEFFARMKMPVMQVYGLTETTAICTMDEPDSVVPGRVGKAIDGCEMKTGEDGEIMVRGPNVFPGYWGRPPHEGWLATGDIGEADTHGNWRIVGRKKNLLVLTSGHNVAPEPLEERLQLALPGGPRVVIVGHGKKHLSALVFGSLRSSDIEPVLAAIEPQLPDHQRIRKFAVIDETLSTDSGLLTANGKLRRAAVCEHYGPRIEEMYR